MRARALQAGIFGNAFAADFLDFLQQIEVETVFVHHIAAGIGAGDDAAAEGVDLLDRVDRDVAGTGNHRLLVGQLMPLSSQHALDEIDRAIAGRFGPRPRPAIGEALAGQHARFIAVAQALILAEHEADLAATHADVACGNVGMLAQIAVQFGHERLAEAHDLAIGTAARVEIRTALAAADRQAGQCVLEDLLEPEELDDAEVHRGVKADAALIGAERRVELNSEAAVDFDLAIVVHPGNAEDDLPFRFADSLDKGMVEIFGMLGDHAAEAFENLPNGLMKFAFSVISLDDLIQYRGYFFIHPVQHKNPFFLSFGGRAISKDGGKEKRGVQLSLQDCAECSHGRAKDGADLDQIGGRARPLSMAWFPI